MNLHALFSLLALCLLGFGCASPRSAIPANATRHKSDVVENIESNRAAKLADGNVEPMTSDILDSEVNPAAQDKVIPTSFTFSADSNLAILAAVEELPAVDPQPEPLNATPIPEQLQRIELETVVQAVYLHFPLIRAAQASRGITAGEAQSAWGAFDNKLLAASENEALGFYENYRQKIGVKRDTTWGGQVFSEYRIGRGNFEPWYLERQTNAGGEFKSGLVVPLSQDRWIDANRAELWRAQLERRRIEPVIQAEILASVLEAKIAYWNWIAAAENRQVVQTLLDFALARNTALEKQVKAGDRAEIELVDNQRLIVSRESKLIEAERKLQQSSIKLSLFLRSTDGAPLIPGPSWIPGGFPKSIALIGHRVDEHVVVAQQTRPETRDLDLVRRQLNIDLSQANNLYLPSVDGFAIGSQDVGQPTSFKRDKSEFELTAGVLVDVPLERNKALGKIRATRAKIAQVTAKRQFTADKISNEVRFTRAALQAAYERVGKIKESADLAVRMELAEQKAFQLGSSNLLNVNLREQQAADAAAELVGAKFDYFVALAEYQAALGFSEVSAVIQSDEENEENLEIPELPAEP